MIRPVYESPIDWRLWSGADPAKSYDLLPLDPNPDHAVLSWADGTPSPFSIRSISMAAPVMKLSIEVK